MSWKPWPGSSVASAADDDDVVAEERAVAQAGAEVGAEVVVDVALEEHFLERLDGVEADVVGR